MHGFLRVARLGAVALAAYGALLAYFKLNEDRFLYHPDRGPLPSAEALGLPARRVDFRSGDTVPLVAWAISPPSTVPADSAPWLLYCHGNGGSIGHPGYVEAWSMLRGLGMGIFAVDYRGYGESGGAPSEKGLYLDAEAAYLFLRDSLRIPPPRIVFYGFSLGSAVAVDLAARLPGGALVVEGSILSVPHRGKELYPFLPVFLLARNRFASVDKIGKAACPKLFIHSRDDEVNPISHGAALFAAATAPKTFLEVSGLHSEAYRLDPRFMQGLGRFLESLGFPKPGS